VPYSRAITNAGASPAASSSGSWREPVRRRGGGLKSIPVGGVSDARLKVAFNRLNTLGQTVQWGVRFNDLEGPFLITLKVTVVSPAP
jgi:hypothetical protein